MAEQPKYSRRYGQFDIMQNYMYAVTKDGSRRPSLRFGKNKHNFPTVTVYTNVESDQANNYGKIEFHTDLPTFMAYIKRLTEFGEGKHEPGTKFGFEYRNIWAGDRNSPEPAHLSTLEVGRYKDGTVYTTVLSTESKRPRIPFFFGPHIVTKAHNLTHNGEQCDIAEMSNEYAAGFAMMIKEVMMLELVINFNPNTKAVAMSKPDQELREKVLEEEKKERGRAFAKRQQANGGGGNYNNNNKYKNSNNNSSAPVDDSIGKGGDWSDDDDGDFPDF